MKTRTLTLNVRNMRDADTGDGWEFDALAVPWNTIDNIGAGVFEKIDRGALTPSPQGVKLRLEHSETIGVITDTRDESDGLYITARISDTAAGRDARTLMLDGALSGLSVGFIPTVEPTLEESDNGVLVTQRAGDLLEVSLVSFPAYKDTAITAIRSNEEKDTIAMTATTDASSLDMLERSVSMLTERVDTLTATPPASPLAAFHSYGEYVKGVASGDENALRAYEGAVTVDDGTARPAWYQIMVDRATAKMRITNLFTHKYTLPADGMTLEYPLFGDDTTKVGKQAKEGDTLPYGKITLTTASATIATYGGYTEVSQQQIDRGSSQYLDILFNRMDLRRVRAIEDDTRALLSAQITANLAASPLSIAKAYTALTVEDIISLLIDAAEYYDEETDTTLDGIGVSKDILTYLASLDAKPKALRFASAVTGEGNQGTLHLPQLSASLASIPVHLIPGEGVFTFFASDAIHVLENPAGGLRLQDSNIINLTKAFSVYSYAAHFAPDPNAIVPIRFGA